MDRRDVGGFSIQATVMRSVHKFSYGHKFERAAAASFMA
jgi:hypothetical protein